MRSPVRLQQAARADPVLVLVGEVQLDLGTGVVLGIPGPHRLEIGAGARRLAGEGELDGPLHRRLASLVGAPHDRQPWGQLHVEVSIAPDVTERQAGDPHSVTSWPPRRRRPSLQGVPELGGLVGLLGGLQLGDATLEVADEGPGDGVRRRQQALGQWWDGTVPDPEPEEAVPGLPLDLVDIEIERRRDGDRSAGRRGRDRGRPGRDSLDERWLAAEPSRHRPRGARSGCARPFALRGDRLLAALRSRVTSRARPAASWSIATGSGAPL